MEHTFKFSVSHPETSEFRDDGPRPFFQWLARLQIIGTGH